MIKLNATANTCDLKISKKWWCKHMTKDEYKKEIIEMVEKIKRSDIIEYIYILTKDIIREDIERSDL